LVASLFVPLLAFEKLPLVCYFNSKGREIAARPSLSLFPPQRGKGKPKGREQGENPSQRAGCEARERREREREGKGGQQEKPPFVIPLFDCEALLPPFSEGRGEEGRESDKLIV
jgi:hypothetical protein